MLNRILISDMPETNVIVLRETEGDRAVPIWIGRPEAEAIQRPLHGVKISRPLTHDLLLDLVRGLGGKVERILIDRFVAEEGGGTFHAKLELTRGEETVTIDCRPSDAVAIAVRTDAPIFVEEEILEAGVGFQMEMADPDGEDENFEGEEEGSFPDDEEDEDEEPPPMGNG